MRFLEVCIPIQMDTGETRMFHKDVGLNIDAAGPTKEGMDEFEMGITNLPYGGAKGGIVYDPK
ncbi:hypothetical protein [Peribacillus simplex]|uniref:hypothetical protein n=1 Tax=Peribacillus simplex TaxID=1478 RepID=UPI003D2D6AD7